LVDPDKVMNGFPDRSLARTIGSAEMCLEGLPDDQALVVFYGSPHVEALSASGNE
jgi:hypothetical protein